MVSPSVAFLERLAVACGEELALDAWVREAPFDSESAGRPGSATVAVRARGARRSSWNKLAGELTLAGARARGELS